MNMQTRSKQRWLLPFVALVLAAALALGGCGRGVQNNTGASSSQSASQATGSSSQGSSASQELQQLQQLDQQTQNDLNTLSNDQQNADQNQGSGQEIVP